MSHKELDAVCQALDSVDREILQLQQNLENAKARKQNLLSQRAEIEQQQQQQAKMAAQAQAAPAKETPEELQARIAELQKQIAMTEQQTEIPEAAPEKKGGWRIFGRGKKGKDNVDENPAPSTTPVVAEAAVAVAAPSSPRPAPTPAPVAHHSPPPSAKDPPVPVPTAVAPTSPAEASKKPLDWERPGWAHAMKKQEDDRAVDSDPISNPNLHQAQDTGYRRKVFAKDIDIDRGNFVKMQARAPDPRLAWIVLRIDGKGVPGKVVMHLYGKDLHDLVDHFLGLKETSVIVGGPNRAAFTVQSEPPLYVTTQGAKGLDSNSGVYGVVQEGHDVVNKIVSAGENATLNIKQAHIFPVKKSKGGI